MTIAPYVRLLRQHWLLVALITLAGSTGAAGYSWWQTPLYQARTQLFVSASGEGPDATQLAQGSVVTQQRVKSYADLLTSPRVLEPVIRQLGLPETEDQLAGRVEASSPLDTVLIDILVTDASPARARDTANAIALAFPGLVADLETPAGRTSSPVKVSVTRRATAATAPVSPRRSLNLALGLLVGLGLGVGASVLRDAVDRTVTSRQQAIEVAQAPVLGTVVEDARIAKSPLITMGAFSPGVESYRHLRANIRFLSVDRRLRSLVVTGSVAAEGRTTTAANLAIALAQSGEQVVLIDADLRRPAVAEVFGLPAGTGLTSVLLGEIEVDAALQTWHQELPLRVLTSGPVPPNPSELIGSARMAGVLERLTSSGATVVIDSPPLLPVTDAAVLARVTDGALIVTRVGSTHADQLGSAAGVLRTAGAPLLGVVLNRLTRRGATGYTDGYPAGARDRQQADQRPDELRPPLDVFGLADPFPASMSPVDPPAVPTVVPAALPPVDPSALPPIAPVLDPPTAAPAPTPAEPIAVTPADPPVDPVVPAAATPYAGDDVPDPTRPRRIDLDAVELPAWIGAGQQGNGQQGNGQPQEYSDGFAVNGLRNGYPHGSQPNGYPHGSQPNGYPHGSQPNGYANGYQSPGYPQDAIPPGHHIVPDSGDPDGHWSHGQS